MALLSKERRVMYFRLLGLGTYNSTSIKALQSRYFTRNSDIDGIYGVDTDRLLRHVVNVLLTEEIKNFKPEEFKCDCGGRYCTGYPDRMRVKTLKFLQAIRNYTHTPIIVTSGLRCSARNKMVGGSTVSKHLTGQAVDYYIKGKTDTITSRKALIEKIKNWNGHEYSYCNGYDSNKNRIYSSSMGNAVHTQTR